jgi:hypothetical protein
MKLDIADVHEILSSHLTDFDETGHFCCTSTGRYSLFFIPDWVNNEVYAYNNKHSLRSNKKGCGGKTH